MNIQRGNNHELLRYATFMTDLMEVKEFHIYSLELQENLMSGNIDNVNWRTEFSDIEDEIDFLKRICAIEDYFQIQLDVGGEVRKREYDNVVLISDLIMQDKVEKKWNQAEFRGVLGPAFRKNIEELKEGQEMSLSYVGVCQAELFGTPLEFKYLETYRCAIIQDVDKLQQLAALMDDGDEIKICIVPGRNDSAVSTIHIPEELEKV